MDVKPESEGLADIELQQSEQQILAHHRVIASRLQNFREEIEKVLH